MRVGLIFANELESSFIFIRLGQFNHAIRLVKLISIEFPGRNHWKILARCSECSKFRSAFKIFAEPFRKFKFWKQKFFAFCILPQEWYPKLNRMSTRKDSSEADLPLCKYGRQCYRKNPQHFSEFRHPPKVDDENPNESDDGGWWKDLMRWVVFNNVFAF